MTTELFCGGTARIHLSIGQTSAIRYLGVSSKHRERSINLVSDCLSAANAGLVVNIRQSPEQGWLCQGVNPRADNISHRPSCVLAPTTAHHCAGALCAYCERRSDQRQPSCALTTNISAILWSHGAAPTAAVHTCLSRARQAPEGETSLHEQRNPELIRSGGVYPVYSHMYVKI